MIPCTDPVHDGPFSRYGRKVVTPPRAFPFLGILSAVFVAGGFGLEFKIAVMGGDGIGPEVTDQGVRALEAVGSAFGHSFDLSYGNIGGISIDKHGIPFTDEVRAMSGDNDAVLFGAVGGPKWDDPNATVRPEQGLLDIRAHMGVFANIRPVKVYPLLADASPLKPGVLEGVDMVVVRELTGGLLGPVDIQAA